MCDNCQKGCSIFWCFIFMLTGIFVVGIGGWYVADDFVFDTLVMEKPEYIDERLPWNGYTVGMMVVGSYLFIMGILGMASGCGSNRRAIVAFLVLGSIGTIGCIALAGISTYSYVTAIPRPFNAEDKVRENEVAQIFKNNLVINYETEVEDNGDVFEHAWKRYQGRMECCGVNNLADYENSTFYNTENHVPWSCCVMTEVEWNVEIENVLDIVACRQEAQNLYATNYTYLNPEGCREDIIWRVWFNRLLAMSVLWGSVFFQILAMFIAGCLKEDLKITWIM